MITALDTNVLSDLLDQTPRSAAVSSRLGGYARQGPLVICGVVYAELHGRRNTSRAAIDTFLTSTGIRLDLIMSENAWAEAGRANADYHARRRAGGARGIRPILPDFLIGAHALHRADRLFTLNAADFSDFPALKVVTL